MSHQCPQQPSPPSPGLDELLTIPIARDIKDLAEGFVANRREQRQLWRQALVEENTEVLYHLGHELKGTAGAFGFFGLAKLAEQLEEAVTNRDLKRAETLLERMIDFLDRVTIVPG